MTKKPKKAKTPKAPKARGASGRGKDPITGLYVEATGNRGSMKILSGKTYTRDDIKYIDSSLETNTYDSRVSGSFRFDLSDKYIVYTEKWAGSHLWDGDPKDPSRLQEDYIFRSVLEGKFNYSNKKLVNSTLFTQADIRADFMKDPLTGEKYNYPWVSGQRDDLPGVTIPFGDGLNWFNTTWSFGEGITKATFSRREEGFDYGSSSDEALVNQVGGGRLFNEGWWNAPFTPNLI